MFNDYTVNLVELGGNFKWLIVTGL